MKIKIDTVFYSPVLCAACGAVLGFYCFFPLYHSQLISAGVLFIPVLVSLVALSLLSVLATYPLTAAMPGDETPVLLRRLKLAPPRIAAFAFGLVLGIGAGSNSMAGVTFAVREDTISGISGTLLEDPRIVSNGKAAGPAGGRGMASLSLKMTMSGGTRATAKGEITVFFPEESAGRLQEFGRGTEISAEGYLRVPDINRPGYLFIADSLHIQNPAPPLERFRTGVRLSLIRRFSRPHNGARGGLAQALLLGVRDSLDSGFAASYRDAGCSHILALSGMHLAVLAALISLLFGKALGMKLAAIVGSLIIIIYCFLVGPLPSLNRAALMYLLGVLAVLGMLKRDPLSLLCMAFLIQIAVTPSAGRSLSFILSYLALAGILVIGAMVNRILKGKVPDILLLPLSASLGAFLATAGVVIFSFGVLRPVGLVAGIVLAPLATVFMVGSVAWLVLDLVSPAVSFFLHWPLSLLYMAMDKTSSWAAYVPGIKANPHVILWLSLVLMAFTAWFDFRRTAASSRLDPFQ